MKQLSSKVSVSLPVLDAAEALRVEVPVSRVLDIGCGTNKQPGSIGLDVNPRTAADIIHDLDDLPYPFDDDRFDQIIASHVIEHVNNPMGVMCELHRITRHGGLVKLLVPHWTNPDFASDLTHRNHLNSYSFRTFIDGSAVFPFYSSVRFNQLSVRVTLLKFWRRFGLQILVNLDNRFPALRFIRKLWEHYLNAIVRGKEIYFVLEVVKPDPARGNAEEGAF